ncbi:hypothetical protein NKH18_17435 [Streptomyces sp. M10(2022)]
MRPADADAEAGWNHATADLLPLLAARTFAVDITVVDGTGRSQLFSAGPLDPTGHLQDLLDEPGQQRPHVVLSLTDRHYQLAVPTDSEPAHSRSNRHNGGPARPGDPLVFGERVAPKRVKPEERDAAGDVRVNPLWTPLDEIDPDLLITGNKEAVWIYTVTGDGQVLLGSEQPSGVVTPEQFDALLTGMRRADPS